MNFGDRLKQIRTEKGLTQPQFAQMAGIEQSYLSKLENDKSVPSAEMFSTILSGLEMDEASFLQDVDRDVLVTTLSHIPAVAQFNANAAATQIHDSKKWLFGSALAWIVGFALMLAANQGVIFSNKLYRYNSPGVILAGEPDNIFDKYRDITMLKMMAKIITPEEMAKQQEEFQVNRARPLVVEWPYSRGTVYAERVDNGHRLFQLVNTESVQAPGNLKLQFLGGIVFACGFVGLFLEWRLRRLKSKLR